MIRKQWIVGAGLLTLGLGIGFATGFKIGTTDKNYSDYEECIFDLLPKARTARAAIILRIQCEKKFTPPNPFDQFDPK